jgi:hypothetical protein
LFSFAALNDFLGFIISKTREYLKLFGGQITPKGVYIVNA